MKRPNSLRVTAPLAVLVVMCLLSVTLLVQPLAARASQRARVLLVHPEQLTPLLEEILIRMRGELSAVGLSVEMRTSYSNTDPMPAFEPDTYGVLTFRVVGATLQVRAFAPDSELPVVQTLDTRDATLTAEVVAIRAVESLRAAMLPYARAARDRQRELPAPVSGFTKLEPKPKPEPAPLLEAPSEPPTPAVPSSSSDQPMSLSLWVGPNFTSDPDASATNMGAQAGIYLGKHWFSAGASLRTSLSPTAIRSPVGRAEIQRLAALAQIRGKLDMGNNSAVGLQLGGGLIHFAVDGQGEEGFEGRTAQHYSPVFHSEILAAQWFAAQFGAYLSLDVSLATDAPKIRMGEQSVANLQQPSISGSIGIIIGRR